MQNTITMIVVSLLSLFIGYSLQPACPVCPICTRTPCPVCDFNITGSIKEEPQGLFASSKHKISIYFNGIESIQGYLSKENEANLVGTYKGQTTNAQCSGASSIKCQITYDNKTTTITFNKDN